MKRKKIFHYREIILKLFFFLSLLALIPICNSCLVSKSSRTPIFYDVQIISDPPGARIEINGNYVGDAPLTVKIEGFQSREFKESTTIVAYPNFSGGLTDRKYFSKGYVNLYGINEIGMGDKIPERILFVGQVRGTNKYDININK